MNPVEQTTSTETDRTLTAIVCSQGSFPSPHYCPPITIPNPLATPRKDDMGTKRTIDTGRRDTLGRAIKVSESKTSHHNIAGDQKEALQDFSYGDSLCT